MQSLPPNPAGPGPFEFLLRVAMGIISLIMLVAMVAFGAVLIGVLLLVIVAAGIWVRWKAGKEGMDWRQWLANRANRGVHAGMRAGWREARRSDAEADARMHARHQAADFRNAMNTIEGDYAVVEEESTQSAASRAQAHQQSDKMS